MCALALFAVIGTSSPLLAADVDTTSIGFACGRLIIRNDGAIAWPGQNGLT